MVQILCKSGHLFLCQINPVNYSEKEAVPETAPLRLSLVGCCSRPACQGGRLVCVLRLGSHVLLALCLADLTSMGLRVQESTQPPG